MASPGAPLKQGIDYHGWFHKDPFREEIFIEFGWRGEGIFCRLHGHIFDVEGYYCKWSEKELKRFAMRNSMSSRTDLQAVNDVVEELLHNGYFDKAMFEQFGILTNERIQKYFLFVTYKRRGVQIDENYLLQSVKQWIFDKNMQKNKGQNSDNEDKESELLPEINTLITSNNPEINEVIPIHNMGSDHIIPSNNPTSIVKESIVKQSEAKQSNFSEFHSDDSTKVEFVAGDQISTEAKEGDNMSGTETSSNNGKKSTKGAGPDPARADIIRIWSEKIAIGQSYDAQNQNKADNAGLVAIIRNLRAITKAKMEKIGPIPENTDLTPQVISEWQFIADHWGELKDYYRTKIQFKDIGKDINNIIYSILDSKNKQNGKSTKPKKTSTSDYSQGFSN